MNKEYRIDDVVVLPPRPRTPITYWSKYGTVKSYETLKNGDEINMIEHKALLITGDIIVPRFSFYDDELQLIMRKL